VRGDRLGAGRLRPPTSIYRTWRVAGSPADELHQLYALEEFLTRLALSSHANHLILTGGALLAAYDIRRPTLDIDLAARTVHADLDSVRELGRPDRRHHRRRRAGVRSRRRHRRTIRDQDQYSGVRVSLT
jgi:hypothetical protein